MCDYCKAATVGEAEAYYKRVEEGKVDSVMETIFGTEAPRADLRSRQKEEIELGLFDDTPDFKVAITALCNRTGLDIYDFERMLVQLRQQFGRPVWSNDTVYDKIAAVRAVKGLAVEARPSGGHTIASAYAFEAWAYSTDIC